MTYAPKPVVITPFDQIVAIAFFAAIGFVVIRNAIARRHWIAWHAARFVRGFIPYFLSVFALIFVMVLLGFRGIWIQYFAMAVCTPVFSLAAGPDTPNRSRRIPSRVRRAVIQRHIRRTGSFDPKTQEIDHLVPFSRGGWHTTDNLWVVPKKVNRAKGTAMPTLEDWLRFTFRRSGRRE